MKKLILLSIATTLFISCGESNKKQHPEIKTVSSEPIIHEPAKLQAEFNNKLIKEAYKNYNAIKSGLVNSDVAQTQKAAKIFLKTLDQLESTEELKEMAHKIASVTDLATQREVFQYLTEGMVKLVEGNLTSGKLYYQYCPMAFGGKGGFWLSNTKDIKNPYYGDSMLKCGEVRKVIE